MPVPPLPAPIIRFMLFIPPIPMLVFIMLFMLVPGCAKPDDAVGTCLCAPAPKPALPPIPAPGGGGRLNPDGVPLPPPLPLDGGGGSEKDDDWFMAGLGWPRLMLFIDDVMPPKAD